MNISVIGTGYVGLVTGTCLAKAGHNVSCVDIDADKVQRMQAGEVPIYEPGLEALFKQVQADKKLVFTTSLAEGMQNAEVIFLALPTPPGADGSADLSAVLTVAEQLGPLLQKYTVIVDKSTVPVGTAEQVAARIAAHSQVAFDVVSNPEFLREGLAIEDFTKPDRIVIGTSSEEAYKVMQAVYESFIDQPEQLVAMDIRSAELTKYAANSFLAMKVSFMNEIANLSEMLGADVEAVRKGIGPDARIGTRFLQAGIGFGGSCFPKDVLALHKTSQNVGYDFKLLGSIITVNALQKQRLIEKVKAYYPEGLAGKHFALWGLAFKPDTDDIRDAPSLEIIDSLLEAGTTVCAYDPQAIANVRKKYGDRPGLTYQEDALHAADKADALLIATEWEEFCKVDLASLKTSLKAPVIFDGRNMYEPANMQTAGFYYEAIGRPVLTPSEAIT